MIRQAGIGTVRLPLSDGQWLEVKEELSTGDVRKMRRESMRREGNAWFVDPEALPYAVTLAYVVDWSLTDARGVPLPITREALGALALESVEEIDAAIEAHDAAVQEKNAARTGKPKS